MDNILRFQVKTDLLHIDFYLKLHRTEFHMKFLWGSKGALATADDRHTKLEQVLSLMAAKFCGYDNGGGGNNGQSLHADQAG